MGSECRHVYRHNLNLTAEQREDPAAILSALESRATAACASNANYYQRHAICFLQEVQEDLQQVNQADYLNVTGQRLEQIRRHTDNDEGLQALRYTVTTGWPDLKEQTSIPVTNKLLEPVVVTGVTEKLQYRRQLAKSFYDRSARVLPELEVGETVRMKPPPGDTSRIWRAGTCLGKVAPRSYLVDMDGSVYRRNRVDLRVAESGAALGFGDSECVPTVSSERNQLLINVRKTKEMNHLLINVRKTKEMNHLLINVRKTKEMNHLLINVRKTKEMNHLLINVRKTKEMNHLLINVRKTKEMNHLLINVRKTKEMNQLLINVRKTKEMNHLLINVRKTKEMNHLLINVRKTKEMNHLLINVRKTKEMNHLLINVRKTKEMNHLLINVRKTKEMNHLLINMRKTKEMNHLLINVRKTKEMNHLLINVRKTKEMNHLLINVPAKYYLNRQVLHNPRRQQVGLPINVHSQVSGWIEVSVTYNVFLYPVVYFTHWYKILPYKRHEAATVQ
uniref:Uncharacterized protein n=1 Tax=Knipowitschia caucasica TaxID=637954 RepID=A0AAV2MGJ3_KNICA